MHLGFRKVWSQRSFGIFSLHFSKFSKSSSLRRSWGEEWKTKYYAIIIHRRNLFTASDDVPPTSASSIIFQGSLHLITKYHLWSLLSWNSKLCVSRIWSWNYKKSEHTTWCSANFPTLEQHSCAGLDHLPSCQRPSSQDPCLEAKSSLYTCSFQWVQGREAYSHAPESLHISKFSTIQSHHYAEGYIASC